MSDSDRIPLSDVLAKVAEEIRKAHSNAVARGDAVLAFDGCEIEFSVDIEKSGDAGVKFWVINLGAGVKKKDSNKIKLKYSANQLMVAAAKNAGEALGEIARQPAKKKGKGTLTMANNPNKIVRTGKKNPSYTRPAASDWLQQHWEDLPQGSWVAANGAGVVSSAPSYEILLEKLRGANKSIVDLVVAFVGRKGDLC